ncbi:MAG: glycosyltransferase family 4 protein [Pseudomonadota bacterium]|nr:glycosyltransferase family 4 protein [Pseudomonadota bacterium]
MNAAAEAVPANRPLRVLHLRDSPWVDGPGRTILETGSHIDPARVEYHIGAFVSGGKHPLVEGAQARGLNVHVIQDQRGIASALVDRIVELMDRLNIDVLHTSEFRSNVLALLCRRRRPVKLVSTVHGWIANNLRGRVFRVIDKAVLPRFDAVIMVSQATRALVPRWWLPDRRVQVLPNALVLGVYGREIVEASRVKRDTSAGAILLNVGRLSPEKGQDVLLRAVAALVPRYPQLKLKFAGIGPMEAELRALAATLGIAQRVEFLGYIEQMPKLYADIDLVVQSSFTEGMPNVILEAAYLRVPIVATAVGGTAEVVEHGKSGWLIPPYSLEALTAGIERYLRDPDEFARMGDAAHARVCAEFSFDVRNRRLMDFYERLCGDRA